MKRQRQGLGVGNANGRLTLHLMNTRKGQLLTHKTENLFDIIYDNLDCPGLSVARGFQY